MSNEIRDQVPADGAGAREIGFAIPQVYNASRVLFDNLARGCGDKVALIGPAGTRTYAELCNGGLPLGQRLCLAGPQARRSRAAVPR
ncbi:hypothetical protein ACVW0I_008265 [Bradyrhizobium sp. LM6.11]